MKIVFVLGLWLGSAAAAIVPATALAQVPFSSTQSPGMNPFNRNTSTLPVNNPPRTTGQQGSQTLANPNGSMQAYPSATGVVGPADPDHKLGPGDVMSYRVAEDRDERVYPLTVTASGEVELPLGSLRVKATGRTTQQLASDIKGVLEREYYFPGHATIYLGLVSVPERSSKGRAYFTGEVNSRGALDLPADGDLTVVQAIMQLGGFTPDADLKKVFIFRNGGAKAGIRVNAKAVLNGENDKDAVLQPGDKVRVDRKFIGVQF